MSDVSQSAAGAGVPEAIEGDGEILDAVPVLADEQSIARGAAGSASTALERHAGAVIPAVQAAAVAAGGFVAGAAVVGLVHRRQRRALLLAKPGRRAGKLARGGARRSGRAAELVQIVGSRSLLVDVHLLGGADPPR
jgi:hypothetical protein